jgi:hypothetical protein
MYNLLFGSRACSTHVGTRDVGNVSAGQRSGIVRSRTAADWNYTTVRVGLNGVRMNILLRRGEEQTLRRVVEVLIDMRKEGVGCW